MTARTTARGTQPRAFGSRRRVSGREDALHWGAAAGALLLAVGGVADTMLAADRAGQLVSQLQLRLAAVAVLMVGCGLALVGVCVHLDTLPPKRLSWVAVVVAVIGWVSVLPACAVLVTGATSGRRPCWSPPPWGCGYRSWARPP